MSVPSADPAGNGPAVQVDLSRKEGESSRAKAEVDLKKALDDANISSTGWPSD